MVRNSQVIRRGLAAALTAMLGVAAVGVAPASATHIDGTGLSTHVGVPFSLPPDPPCAHYTRYDATVTYPQVAGHDSGTFVVASGIDPIIWNEGPGGTYNYAGPLVNNCPPEPYAGGVDPIGGFLVTKVGDPTCVAVPATYQRADIDITVIYGGGLGQCSGTLKYSLAYVLAQQDIPPFFLAGDHIAACAPIIAPATCVIGGRLA